MDWFLYDNGLRRERLKEKQFEMLRTEARAATGCERRRILKSILLQPFTYYKLDSNKRLKSSQFHKTDLELRIKTKN